MSEYTFSWETPNEFGIEYLAELRKGNYLKYDEYISGHIISEQLKKSSKELMRRLEDIFTSPSTSDREKMIIRFKTAYILSKSKNLEINGKMFETPEELFGEMRRLQLLPGVDFENFCRCLIGSDSVLDPQLEVWLLLMGKSEMINKFYARHKATV